MKRDFEELDDIQQKVQTIPEELPILPVRDAVIFPNAVIPLTVGRESSVKLIDEAISGGKLVGVFTQKDPTLEASFSEFLSKVNDPFFGTRPGGIHPSPDAVRVDVDRTKPR